ncbi:uncharacterized protein LOC113521304 isoform X2 [Galleria mellonella]|uniref:Uncharacterized protein LOC113521304 isoform X2 n=1 Tax=Galleria mellonella TaxID=7137 RepID=A0A6J3C9U7_GALME|nr:uncharacterized protein LOC113521304 isoform X2 [Galleria mellonella]
MHTSMIMVSRDVFLIRPAVNSPTIPHRDVSGTSTTTYRPYNEEYASIPRRVERPVQTEVEAERIKKDKKWSIGKLFRRKKKDEESGSSSESDEGVSTRSPSKRKAKKKKKTPALNNFDHIVVRDSRRAQSLAKPTVRDITDDGVLSDPSAGFLNYRAKTHLYGASKESLSLKDDNSNRTLRTGLETPSRKTRKGRLKARVEALRNSMRGESSSDEESLKSSNSSSMIRFRSDDSLMRSRDSSLNKRTRSARNERYVKRLSRDEENQLNKEAELIQQGYTKAEVEMLTRTPTSQSSGYGTCKREQNNKITQDSSYISDVHSRPLKSDSVSSFPSTQSYPSSINFNAKVNNELINYSIQCPNNIINREPLYANNNRERSVSNHYEKPDNVMCVKFPLGNVTNIKREDRAPPVPPPRDMQRKVATPLSMYYENNSVMTDRMGSNQNIMHGVPNNDFDRIMRRSQERSISQGFNGLRRPISTSEDHIAMQNNDFQHSFQYKNDQPRRPASVSAEPNHYGLYANTPPWRKKVEQSTIIRPEPVQLRQDYLYYADQSPRSRRPISIKSSQNGYENQYLSDSQATLGITENIYRKPRNASEFWRKIDDAERQRKQQGIFSNSRSKSDYTNNMHTNKMAYVDQNKINLNKSEKSDIQNKNKIEFRTQSVDTTDGAKIWKATTEYKRSVTVEPPKTIISPNSKTHVRHKSDTFIPNSYTQMTSDDEKSSERRKSTNLDDALNELEAIYNSLGLGDEDLLDRAERRELMTPKFNDHFNDWNGNDDDIQLRSQPTTPLRRVPRRSTLPDKLQDDMAFRRMNSLTKDKSNYKDTQAQISYMLASPVYVPYASDDDKNSDHRNEPDIVHDDVVYRNIKQTNNRLKTLDPQPPFGIPLGPVTPAPQSDYLHATPENKTRSRFVPRKSPDLVSDDLAYRNLRKDNRHSTLFNGDDYNIHVNNNQSYTEFPFTKESVASLKKKRAVRSLSANIFTMIQKEIDEAVNMSKMATLQKTNSNSDVMRRLRETFENNDNEQDYYPRNKVKHRHNTVSLFVNNTHTPTSHFAKDDTYIHNDDKYLAKPPSYDKSKSSSPSNRSPQSSKRSSKDEFQQVLSMLAQEAMDTSNKLGVALAELDKNRNNTEKKSDIQSKISDSRLNFLNGLTGRSLDDPSSEEVKIVNIHSEIVEPNDKYSNRINQQTKAKKTEDSLLAISDQLHKVEDQLKHSFEKELKFEDESLRLSKYITKAEEQLKAEESTVVPTDNKLVPDVVPLNIKNDAVKVENIGESTNKQENNVVPEINSLNPFLNIDDKIKEINEINAFKELKDGISDLIAGITQVNEKLLISKSSKPENNSTNNEKITGITEASEKLNRVTQNISRQELSNRGSVNLSIYEDDLDIKKDAADSTEYNSSEELSTIFKLNENNAKPQITPVDEVQSESENTIRDELSSPKLVQSMNQQLRRFSVDQTNDNTASQSNSLPTNIVPWRTNRQSNSDKEKRGDNTQSKRSWHDTGTLMLACSYTLMFSQHLADLDWLTLLGLLLAIITIIAMLII